MRQSQQPRIFFWFVGFIFLVLTTTSYSKDTQLKAADLVTDKQPININSSKYQKFFSELIDKHEFTQEELNTLFQGITIDKKVLQLMDKQWEGKPYYEYRPLFITPTVINDGKKYLKRYHELFDHIEGVYGVNREVIVAIWAIESRFGSNQGGFNLFRTLNTLFEAYPRRSEFFRKELIHFILLCKANDIDPLEVHGSYAGAFGQAQFMPSSYNAYAVDFDGDSRRDLISSMPDIFASIANYLKTFGWTLDSPVYVEIGNSLRSSQLIATHAKGRTARVDWRYVAKTQDITLPRPPRKGQLSIIGLEQSPQLGEAIRYVAGYPNFQAITEYNHSNKYAMAVSEMAESFTK
ncbi:MAG: membrane-bound lytic murein transglycosylase B [Desulforhopalus sp.]|jgi:membrane-bound lytic murein transglycosylase B